MVLLTQMFEKWVWGKVVVTSRMGYNKPFLPITRVINSKMKSSWTFPMTSILAFIVNYPSGRGFTVLHIVVVPEYKFWIFSTHWRQPFRLYWGIYVFAMGANF